MSWFFLALLAPIIWSIGNHIDSYLVRIFTKDESASDAHSVGSLIIISCIVGITVLPIAIIINPDIFLVSLTSKILLMLTGIIEGFAILAYLYAIYEDDIASVTAWFNSIPFISLILGFIILGEVITGSQLIGFFITLTGLVILSVRKTEIGFIFKKRVMGLMLSSSLGYSIMTILFKVSTPVESFWISAFWQYVGLSVLGIFFFIGVPRYQQSFIKLFKARGVTFYGINAINEFLFMSGTMIANYAALLAPIALVSLLGSFQPLIVLGMGIVIGVITGKKPKSLSQQEKYTQLLGIVLSIAGLLFIL